MGRYAMTEYTLRVPVAMCGDVIALCLVAEAMARHAATGYGTLPLHRPSFNNLLPKRVALLVDAACHGQLKVCDCNGLIKPAKEIIEAKDKLNIDSPDPELNALSLYVKKQHLIEWGNANGDVFHIVDAPAEVVEFGPKNAHGEFAVRGFVGGLDASAAKVEALPVITHAPVTINKLKRNTLDPAIEKAIKQAGNTNLADVYLKLKELAKDEEPPFTGAFKGDALCYTNDNNLPDKLSKNALGKKLKRRAALPQ